jgi:hypothetical protein
MSEQRNGITTQAKTDQSMACRICYAETKNGITISYDGAKYNVTIELKTEQGMALPLKM